MVCIHTINQNQITSYPFIPYKISILIELTLGHLHFILIYVLPNQTPYLTMYSNRFGSLKKTCGPKREAMPTSNSWNN